MKGRIFIITLVALIAAGCGQNRKAEQFQALPFPDVKIPAMMTGSADVAEYISMHYWDGLTDPSRDYPCDSLYVSGVKKEDVEQKFADWNAVLGVLPRSIADKAVNALYEKAAACERKDTSSNVLDTFVMLAEKYFYDPNSPVRNEDHYHAFVRNLASFEGFDEAVRGKYAYQARMTALNREGTVAADFRFADRNGRIHSLHGINAPMTLLFFSNPGCDACMEIIKVLSGHEGIASMIADGRLAVLNIYIDEDIQAWRDYMPIYPEQWYNGFDPDLVIRGETLYNVRAIPSLYLLDHEKRVILKDAPENRVFDMLLSL